MRLGRWQQVLVDALVEQPAIGVRATIQDHLGRPPTRAELIAARRAANRLGDLAQVVHLRGVSNTEDRLVLVRPGVCPRGRWSMAPGARRKRGRR